jgi:hypothetical protein
MNNHGKMHIFGMLPAAIVLATVWGAEAGAQATLAQRRDGSVSTATIRYADGVYTATGQYGGAPSFITATVTLRRCGAGRGGGQAY